MAQTPLPPTPWQDEPGKHAGAATSNCYMLFDYLFGGLVICLFVGLLVCLLVRLLFGRCKGEAARDRPLHQFAQLYILVQVVQLLSEPHKL